VKTSCTIRAPGGLRYVGILQNLFVPSVKKVTSFMMVALVVAEENLKVWK
jgi:hypothetical protein